MGKFAHHIASKLDDVIVLSSDSESEEDNAEGQKVGNIKNMVVHRMDIDPSLLEAEVNIVEDIDLQNLDMKAEDTANHSAPPDNIVEECILPDFDDDVALDVLKPDVLLEVNPPNTLLEVNPPNALLEVYPPDALREVNPPDALLEINHPDVTPPIIIKKPDEMLFSPIVSTTKHAVLQKASTALDTVKAGSSPAGDPKPIEINGKTAVGIPQMADCCSSTEASAEILEKPKAAEALKKLIEVLKTRITKSSDFDIVEKRLWRNYGRLSEAADTICGAIEGCCTQILLDDHKMWRTLKALFKYFKDCSSKSSGSAQLPTYCLSATEVEDRRQQQLITLEKQLANYEELIEKMDKKDTNWDDEFNSPYLIRTRMINKYMKGYERLCKAAGCNTLTDRPTQKKITLKVSKYPEIDLEVEGMINRRDYRCNTPDFFDVYRIAEKVKDEHKLELSPTELRAIALELFQAAASRIKFRRQKDSYLALKLSAEDGFGSVADPADNDEELARKLEENRLKRRTEIDVLKEFTAKETEVGEVAVEVPDDEADESTSETSDEEDNSEDDLAEGIDVDTEDEDNENKSCSSKRKLPKTSYKPVNDDPLSSDSNSDTSGAEQEIKQERLTKKPRLKL